MPNDPTISLAPSGNLALRIESDTGLSHVVELPNGDNGLRLLQYILISRQSGQTRIGQNGNPTQEMIKLWLANKFETDTITRLEDEKTRDDAVLEMF